MSGQSSYLAAISGEAHIQLYISIIRCNASQLFQQNSPLVRDFFLNLDNLHDYLKYTFPKVINNQEEPQKLVPAKISICLAS